MRKKSMRIVLAMALAASTISAGCGERTADWERQEREAESEAGKAAGEEAAAEREAAAKAQAYYEAGRASLYGLDGTETDYAAAYDNFVKALELGCAEANFYLGVLADWYRYPEQDYEAARNYYEASGEHPGAWVSLGFLYENGQGVEEDREKAAELFWAAVDAGYTEGYFGLGDLEESAGNYEAALENYEKAVTGSEQVYAASAMASIGVLYFYGQGVPQDDTKAMEWFEKAAGLGDSGAMNYIGAMYYYGQGVPKDEEKALEWYQKAAGAEGNL